jgi:hypothetical protein
VNKFLIASSTNFHNNENYGLHCYDTGRSPQPSMLNRILFSSGKKPFQINFRSDNTLSSARMKGTLPIFHSYISTVELSQYPSLQPRRFIDFAPGIIHNNATMIKMCSIIITSLLKTESVPSSVLLYYAPRPQESVLLSFLCNPFSGIEMRVSGSLITEINLSWICLPCEKIIYHHSLPVWT